MIEFKKLFEGIDDSIKDIKERDYAHFKVILDYDDLDISITGRETLKAQTYGDPQFSHPAEYEELNLTVKYPYVLDFDDFSEQVYEYDDVIEGMLKEYPDAQKDRYGTYDCEEMNQYIYDNAEEIKEKHLDELKKNNRRFAEEDATVEYQNEFWRLDPDEDFDLEDAYDRIRYQKLGEGLRRKLKEEIDENKYHIDDTLAFNTNKVLRDIENNIYGIKDSVFMIDNEGNHYFVFSSHIDPNDSNKWGYTRLKDLLFKLDAELEEYGDLNYNLYSLPYKHLEYEVDYGRETCEYSEYRFYIPFEPHRNMLKKIEEK